MVIIGKIKIKLPAFSPVIKELSELVESDRSSVDDISRVIEKDQSLTSRVLKLANSPFYGFPRKIKTVKDAVILVGFNTIKSLAICSSTLDTMREKLRELWEHSLFSASLAEEFANILNVRRPEEVSTAALIHDIGKVILFSNFGDRLKKLCGSKNPSEKEIELFGVTHTDVVKILGEEWNLPERLIEPASNHHNPGRSKVYTTETSIVHLSNIISKIAGYSDSIYTSIEKIDESTWDSLSLSKEEIKRAVRASEDRMEEEKAKYGGQS